MSDPLNQRLRQEALNDEEPTYIRALLVEAAEAIEHLAADDVRLRAETRHYQSALVAHHDLATLSDDVIREYNWRECPVCARAK